METSVLARLSAVSHRYGTVEALSPLELEVPAGVMVGFIGPDGVGKSSVLALIAGVRRVQRGTVEVFGGDISEASFRASVQPRIAYMPQGLGKNLYPTLSVWENVEFFARLFGQSRAERSVRIEALLQATGLAAFRDRPAMKLSGGMKQKLGLCCALIHDPDLLILDEPTTGVDPLSRRQFWELIDGIRARRPGMSVLVATAYMEEAARFDWLVAMDAGKVLDCGTPAALRARTGLEDLEAVFIALLPAARRRGHHELAIPPRPAGAAEVAIRAAGLTQRFGDFTAVDHVSFEIGKGEIFGEIALLDGRPRTTDAIAHTNCELAILERRDFLPFIRSQPLLAMKFVELLCMRLRRTSEQIEHIILQDLSGRLAGALLGLADRRQPDAVSRSIAITQQELGEMVGMTRESINKQLREWAERKWVRLEHGGILLLDAKALANVAETGRADDSWNVHPNT